MPISVFISAVSDEFLSYRDHLRRDLTRHNVAIKVQEDFKGLGGDTLDKLDAYIACCNAVVHLVGEMTGSAPGPPEQKTLVRKYPGLPSRLPPLADALQNNEEITYTQWEAWLALYHDKILLIAQAAPAAPRGQGYQPTDPSRQAQAAHLKRLTTVGRYPDCSFTSQDELAKQIAYSKILDLLAQDAARQQGRARDGASGQRGGVSLSGPIGSAGDVVGGNKIVGIPPERFPELIQAAASGAVGPLAGMIRDLAGQLGVTQDAARRLLRDLGQDDVAPERLPDALAAAAAQIVAMRAALAATTNDDSETTRLRQAAVAALDAGDFDGATRRLTDIRARERAASRRRSGAAEEARADWLAGLKQEAATCALLARAALAQRDPAAARGHYQEGLDTLTPAAASDRWSYALDAGKALDELGGRAGLNDALVGSIHFHQRALAEIDRTEAPLDWARTQNNLGNALLRLGERESGTARLEAAVAAYRAALEERTRDRVPLDWARTQHNLGTALLALGERESGTARLKEAVAAYRAALEEGTRDRVPLDWARTQHNLGTALLALGERESGTARLKEAVAAYRAALEEATRDRVPLDWAMTQHNLGNALLALGERESGTARLEAAVAAYRAALEERTRDRVPLAWARTQHNLGTALLALGERESGTARLEAAVAAHRAALEERTRDRVPLDWAMTQHNLGNALLALGERESGTARLEAAVAAYRAALEEATRDRVLLDWARTQNNLGNALLALGDRESGTARLEAAVAAYRAALEEATRDRVPLDWARTQHNLGNALLALGERESGTARLEAAVAAYRAALEERTRDRVPLDWATTRGNQGVALLVLAERTADVVMAQTALEQITTAFETMRDGGHQTFAAYYQNEIPRARALADKLGAGRAPQSGA